MLYIYFFTCAQIGPLYYRLRTRFGPCLARERCRTFGGPTAKTASFIGRLIGNSCETCRWAEKHINENTTQKEITHWMNIFDLWTWAQNFLLCPYTLLIRWWKPLPTCISSGSYMQKAIPIPLASKARKSSDEIRVFLIHNWVASLLRCISDIWVLLRPTCP